MPGEDFVYNDLCAQHYYYYCYYYQARIKQEAVNDEMRVKSTVVTLQAINYAQESRNLLEAISKYN